MMSDQKMNMLPMIQVIGTTIKQFGRDGCCLWKYTRGQLKTLKI